jgi:putative membrane protein
MRRICLLLGLALLAAIWLGPLLSVWRESFAAHMLAHMGVVALAAPLLAVGLKPGAAPTGSIEGFATPLIASLLELIVVWGWHAPAARVLVETSNAATFLEQASFLAAGMLLWHSCLRPGRQAAGAFALLLTSVHMTLLGALLALSSRPLYGLGQVSCFGFVLDARQDQELGGVIMLMVGAAVYLAGGIALLAQLLNAPARKAV